MLPSWHASTGGLGKPILSLSDRLLAAWYSPRLTPLSAVLAPLALVFRTADAARKTSASGASTADSGVSRGEYQAARRRSERLRIGFPSPPVEACHDGSIAALSLRLLYLSFRGANATRNLLLSFLR